MRGLGRERSFKSWAWWSHDEDIRCIILHVGVLHIGVLYVAFIWWLPLIHLKENRKSKRIIMIAVVAGSMATVAGVTVGPFSARALKQH
jgi:hypothetical protein